MTISMLTYVDIPPHYLPAGVRWQAERMLDLYCRQLGLSNVELRWADAVHRIPDQVLRVHWLMGFGRRRISYPEPILGWAGRSEQAVYIVVPQPLGDVFNTIAHECRHLAQRRSSRIEEERDAVAWAARMTASYPDDRLLLKPVYRRCN